MDERTCRRCGGRFTCHSVRGRKRFLCYECSPAAPARTPQVSRCEMCGLRFEILGGKQRYCRVECRQLAARNAAAHRPPIGKRARCIICGGPVISRLPQAVVCSRRCKIRRDKDNRRSKDYRDPAGTESCVLCGESFMPPGVASGKYCSGDCEKRVSNSKRYSSSSPRPRITHFDCENCGITCIPGKSGVDWKASRFCSFRCKRSWHRNRRRIPDGQFIDSVSREDIFERDGWKCQLCGGNVPKAATFPDPKSPTLDHIIPLSRGGTHESSNAQLAHFACNSAKGNRVFGDGEQLRLIA